MYLAMHPLLRLISEGEGPTLDFKKTISSAKKIAKTLVAFANSQGGRLLVGVKDNGAVAGIHTEEEMYMIDSAAKLFCRPAVAYNFKVHDYKGLIVLEVGVSESLNKPHQAQNEEGEWRTYIRVKDESILASKVVEGVIRRKATKRDTLIRYDEMERGLLAYLAQYGHITLDEFCNVLYLSRRKATTILINLISAGILRVETYGQQEYYTLAVAMQD